MDNATQQIAGSSDFVTSVNYLFYALLTVSSLVTVALVTLIVFFCIRYRHDKERDRVIRAQHPRYVEYLWIGIPTLVFLVFFVWGASIFLRYQQLPQDALVIDGVSKQWMWKFFHVGGQREINELHVPVNRPVIVRLASEDVIHSFYLPIFRMKQDVVPGRYTQTWFVPRKIGSYHLFCAEFCGTDHSEMRGTVTVMSEQDYAQWLDRQGAESTLASAGASLFRSLGCSGCHSPGAAVRAPDLTNLMGHVMPLSDGRNVLADRAYIRDSIMLPEKDVTAGFDPVMPAYAGQISEEEALELVSYIESLSRAEQTLQTEVSDRRPEDTQ